MTKATARQFIDYSCARSRFTSNPALLVWDSHSSHICTETKNYYKKFKVHGCVIPGGMIKFLMICEKSVLHKNI